MLVAAGMLASMPGECGAFVPRTSSRRCRIETFAVAPEDGRPTSIGRRPILGDLLSAGGVLLAGGFSAASPAQAAEGGPKKALPEEYRQGTLSLSNTDENAAIPREAYVKLPSGLVYADVRKGNNGDEAKVGSKCNIQWVLRRGNGYFVDSSEVSGAVPFIFTVGDTKGAIVGLDEGIRGMKAGGVRRLIIPLNMAYVEGLEDGKPGPLPVGFGPRQQMRRVQSGRKDVPGEYVFLEIQLTRVR